MRTGSQLQPLWELALPVPILLSEREVAARLAAVRLAVFDGPIFECFRYWVVFDERQDGSLEWGRDVLVCRAIRW